MEAKLNLESYGVQELTMAQAQGVDGGIFLAIVAVVKALGVVGTATAVGAGYYSATVFQAAYIQGRRNAGCVCF